MAIDDQPPGATPLRPEELRGLKQPQIASRADLNEAENLNLIEAGHWIARNLHRGELDETFLKALHTQMFRQVWGWAGKRRDHELDNPIFFPPHKISEGVRNAFLDARAQVEHSSCGRDEIAVRLHHRLVCVHPFANGNGRVTRMIADIQVQRLGRSSFSWGGGALSSGGPLRQKYILALQSADKSAIGPLLQFARS